MKRSGIQRHPKPRKGAAELAAMEAFKSAYIGETCAVCARPAAVSHHVVLEQHLLYEDKWRLENALPLCHTCHNIHHDGSGRLIPFGCLTDTNLGFAVEVLGAAASDYLSRRYGGSVDITKQGRHRFHGPPRDQQEERS